MLRSDRKAFREHFILPVCSSVRLCVGAQALTQHRIKPRPKPARESQRSCRRGVETYWRCPRAKVEEPRKCLGVVEELRRRPSSRPKDGNVDGGEDDDGDENEAEKGDEDEKEGEAEDADKEEEEDEDEGGEDEDKDNEE